MSAPIVTATRRSRSEYDDYTKIEPTDLEFLDVYVVHDRNWVEVGGHRIERSPAEVAAWFRAVADVIEQVSR